MVYAVSDLHGCYDKYIRLLERLDLGPDDTLYILGDIVDRGEDGIRIILDLLGRKNIFSCRGNHDDCALLFLKGMGSVSDEDYSDAYFRSFLAWISDGGDTTCEAFEALGSADKARVLSYLKYMPLYEELTVGGRSFFLAHTVPSADKMADIGRCMPYDFIMGEPEYGKTYFEDKFIVTGHTPTGLIDPDFKGRIYKAHNHIAIDCGAVFGNPLGCICLDTLEEIYAE